LTNHQASEQLIPDKFPWVIFVWKSDWIELCCEKTNIAQSNPTMPTFIHNEKQDRAINLESADSIRKENGIRYEIVFESAPAQGGQEGLVEIGRWQFDTGKERDKTLSWILANYGVRV